MIDNATLAFIRLHENDNIHALALQAGQYPNIDMRLVIRQITGRHIAREKIPSWHEHEQVIYPSRLPLEQCSSEMTARYKASLSKTDQLVDLTGGLGVDCYFMSLAASQCIYIERQTELAELAAHNFGILGAKNIRVVNEDALMFLKKMQPVDTIYVDPSRRDIHGRKTVLLEDCRPNLPEIEDLLEEKSRQVIAKLSPMLDISLAMKTLRNIAEVHVVSCRNECKELLFIKESGKKAAAPLLHCVNLLENKRQHFAFTREEEDSSSPRYAVSTGNYLYEPNASVLKAGAYKCLAARYNLSKLHASSHLYTSLSLSEDFPGRIFSVRNILDFNKKNIKQLSGISGKANITVRNFPLSVAEIREKTGVKDGGELYIFATTLADERKVLIVCEKVV
jgi:hypothetical protein